MPQLCISYAPVSSAAGGYDTTMYVDHAARSGLAEECLVLCTYGHMHCNWSYVFEVNKKIIILKKF
jgi:hypothetical protein